MMFLKNYDEITENVMVESINVINKYFQTNKCCELHPSCSHPKEQTDINLFNNNNKSIQILKNTFYDSVKLYLKKDFELIYEKAWGYFTKTMNYAEWHNHVNDDNLVEIPGIDYLSKTNRGTMYESENFIWSTKPKLKTWYLWPSNIQHTPQLGETESVRHIIATAIGVKINGK